VRDRTSLGHVDRGVLNRQAGGNDVVERNQDTDLAVVTLTGEVLKRGGASVRCRLISTEGPAAIGGSRGTFC
jgi:hypothetical protein